MKSANDKTPGEVDFDTVIPLWMRQDEELHRTMLLQIMAYKKALMNKYDSSNAPRLLERLIDDCTGMADDLQQMINHKKEEREKLV